MVERSNFVARAVNAIIEGRTRQAERYVAQFKREHPDMSMKFTKR